jgi:hypothetical protein
MMMTNLPLDQIKNTDKRTCCCLYCTWYVILEPALRQIVTKYKKAYWCSAPNLLEIGVMVFNATFNNTSDISWQSVLLAEETTDLPQVADKLYHIMQYQVHFVMSAIRTRYVSGDGHCLHR